MLVMTIYYILASDILFSVPVCQQWHEFRIQRAGGNKNEDHHQENLGYVNRFLASCAFRPNKWKVVTTLKVAAHDKNLHRHYEAGTVSRILQTMLDFWRWCRNEGFIGGIHFNQVEQYICGCLSSTRKDVRRRNTARRVDEDQQLPAPDIIDKFENSPYITELKKAFKEKPAFLMYDMGCALILLCSFYNAPRPSVFKNMRLKDVDHATTEDDELFTITVGKHKTSDTGGPAFVTVSKELYKLLRIYRKTVADTILLLDSTAPVFRTKTMTPVDSDDVNRMAKCAWKKAGMTESFNLTINRKLTTVTGRMADPTMSAPIARQLCHNVSTADRYYAVHDDRRQANKTYRHLQKSFRRSNSTVTSTLLTSETTATDANGNDSSNEHRDSISEPKRTSASPGRGNSEESDREGSPEVPLDLVPPSPQHEVPTQTPFIQTLDIIKPSKSRKRIDKKTRKEIHDVYLEVILEFSDSFRFVPIDVIRSIREGRWPELTDQQLRDAVRNMVKAAKRQFVKEDKGL